MRRKEKGKRHNVFKVRQAREAENLKEPMFTPNAAFPPNMNSFHVSSLPTCPFANVYGGRLSHLLMSFPQLSQRITPKSQAASDVMDIKGYGLLRNTCLYLSCCHVYKPICESANKRNEAT